MDNGNIKKYSLFSEKILKGIKINGYATKFKTLGGMSEVGRTAAMLKAQLQNDLEATDQFLNIMAPSVIELDPVDVDTEISPADYFYHVTDPDDTILDDVIEDLATWITTEGSDNQIVITLASGARVHLHALKHTSTGVGYITEVNMLNGEDRNLLGSVVYNASDEIQDIYFSKLFVLEGSGDILPVSDMLKDLVDNSNVLTLFSESIITNGNTLFSSLELSSVLARVTAKSENANLIKNDLISIGSQSGLQGVMAYIQQCYKDLASVDDNGSGLLEFTDNSNYSSISILSGVLSLATSVLSTIVAAIRGIAGIIIGIISAIVSLVSKFIEAANKAYEESFAVENDTLQSDPLAQLASEQVDVNIPVDYDAEALPGLFKMLLSNGAPLIVHNGYHFSLLSTNGAKVRIENHLDCYNRISDYFNILGQAGGIRWLTDSPSQNQRTITIIPAGVALAFSQFETHSYTTPDIHDDPEKGRLSADDDLTLRSVIVMNLVLDFTRNLSQFGGTPVPNLVVETTLDYTPATLNGYSGNAYGADKPIADSLAYFIAGLAFMYSVRSSWNTTYRPYFEDAFSWERILQFCAPLPKTNVRVPNTNVELHPFISDIDDLVNLLSDDSQTDLVMPMEHAIEPLFIWPRVNKAKLFAEITGLAVTAIALATTALIVAPVAVRKIKNKRLSNALKVEQAWSNATKDPSDDNIKAYKKAVRKNNLFANIFGGTKYNKLNYWDTSGNTDSISASQTLSDLAKKDSNSDDLISTVYRAIVGPTS